MALHKLVVLASPGRAWLDGIPLNLLDLLVEGLCMIRWKITRRLF